MIELGQRLRASGLTPRALAAWAGTDRLSALPAAIERLVQAEPVPAAVALALFVAGRDVPIDRVPGSAQLLIEEVVERGLAERDAKTLHASVAILPAGRALVVCDRFDAPPTNVRVCWPDDSSYHLVGAMPHGRVASWLDLGCGSAFAPLVRPEVADTITGVELNPVAAHMARLGVGLSGIGHVTIEEGDLAIDQPPAALVTCNAPIPDRVLGVGAGIEMWRHTDDELFERLWRVLPARVAPGGLAVVHAALVAMPYERLAGARRIVVYTPPDLSPAFGVLWWRPDAPDELVITRRELTAERPHIDDADRRP